VTESIIPDINLFCLCREYAIFNFLRFHLDLYSMAAKKITKAVLLKAIDEKLQALNLLRSALQGDPSRKQEDLDNYDKQFRKLFGK